jgi:hypothetical protein
MIQVMKTMKQSMMMILMKKMVREERENESEDHSTKLSYPKTVQTFTGLCQVLKLAEFGRREWNVQGMESCVHQ